MANVTTASNHITLIERFEILTPFAEYREAVTAFCHRVEQDGIPEVLTFQFFAIPESKEAFLIFTLANCDAFEEHVKFIMSQEETGPYAQTVKLREIRVCGTLTKKMEERLSKSDKMTWAGPQVTGFAR